jgi:hypothetical protein
VDDAHAVQVDQGAEDLLEDVLGVVLVELAGGEVAALEELGDEPQLAWWMGRVARGGGGGEIKPRKRTTAREDYPSPKAYV